MRFFKHTIMMVSTLLLIVMAMPWSETELNAQDPNQPPVVRPPAGEPDVTPDDDKTDQVFYRKSLSVRNQSSEKITVFLQFRAFNPTIRKWEWLPSLPTSGQAVAFEIEPGEEKLLETVDRKVVASYVRIWATSENMMWNNFRNNDFFLVPLSENGVREYKAFKLETLTYVFVGPKNPNPDVLEPPTPYNMAVEFAQPLNIIPDQDGNTVVNNSPIDQFISVPLPTPTPILIPDPIPPPDVPIIREADLAVLNLDVLSQGSFTARIRNNGPSTYTGGRAWYLLASFNDGTFRTVLRGGISGLRPGSSMFISGNFPRVTQPARLVLRLTPGDLDENNDVMAVRVMPPPRADLAVSNVSLNNGIVSVNITNHGPTDYSGFFRRCSIADTRGVLTSGPIGKIVPSLAVGQQVTLQYPVLNIDPGPGDAMIASLNGGDLDPSNDRFSLQLQSNNVLVPRRDYAAGAPALVGNQLQAVITSDAGRQFGNSFFSLSYETLDGFKRSDQVRGTVTATPGSPQTVTLALPGRLQNVPLQASLTLTRDANPSNNVATRTFNANQSTKVADIQVLNAYQSRGSQNSVVVQIRNNGPDPYTGNKLVMISGGPSGRMSSNSMPIRSAAAINPGETVRVTLSMNQGATTGQYTASLAQTTPDPTRIVDNNTTNETAVFTFNAGGSPPLGGADVAITAFSIDSSGAISLTLHNNHSRVDSGTRTVTITSPNFNGSPRTITNIIAGQDSIQNFRDPRLSAVTLKLKPGATERFTATIAEQDSNTSNNARTFDYTSGRPMAGGMGVGITTFSVDSTGQVNLSLNIEGARPSTGRIRVAITSPNLPSSTRTFPGISFQSPFAPFQDAKIAAMLGKLRPGATERFTATVAELDANNNDVKEKDDSNNTKTFDYSVGKPTRSTLSISDLKVDQNGVVTFKLTNNSSNAAKAGADQYSLSSDTSPAITRPTPAVPGNSSVIVGDNQAGGSLSVAAIVNKMKPNDKTTFTVQLQSNSATNRFPFTKTGTAPSFTVSNAQFNSVTKNITFVLSNKGAAALDGADTYVVAANPKVLGEIARVKTPAMPTNSTLTIEVQGSAKQLASLPKGNHPITIKLANGTSSTSINMVVSGTTPSAAKVTIVGTPVVEQGPSGLRVKVTVKNEGTTATPASGAGVACKLQPKGPITRPFDLGKQDVANLAGGASKTVFFTNLPSKGADTSTVIATVYP